MLPSAFRSPGAAAPAAAPTPHTFRWTLLALALLLAWDASGLDLPLAYWFGTPAGFPLRDNWFLVKVVHAGGRDLSWLALALLLVGIRWPLGPLRRLGLVQRVQLAASVVLGVGVVSILKNTSHSSCPWDLAAFGGVAHHVSHWAWGVYDGGPGRCFPGGHASAAFAWLGGYFVLRPTAPRAARGWLAAVLALGLVFGWGQQMRGAHYLSHNLWTAWICWSIGWAVDALTRRVLARRAAHAQGAVGTVGGVGANLNEG